MRLLRSLLILAWIGLVARAADDPPEEWIDPDTGHRIVRLSDEPGSESFYFNINPFTPDGKEMVFTSPTGIYAIDLATRKIEKVVEGQRLRPIMVGRKTGQIYYSQRMNVFAADLETKATRKVAELPFGSRAGAVNCDETLLAGTDIDRKGLIKPGVFRSEKLVNMAKHNYLLEPNAMFTPDMKWIIFRSNMFGPSHVFAVEVAKAEK